MRHGRHVLRFKTLLILALGLALWLLSSGSPTIAETSPPPPALTTATVAAQLEAANLQDTDVRQAEVVGDTTTVCLEIPLGVLAADGWLGIERIEAEVRRALTPLPWRRLIVDAWDGTVCRSLSSFAPEGPEIAPSITQLDELSQLDAGEQVAAADVDVAQIGALAGKTVYVSAGHGWYWNGSKWRTQRPVYQGFIEDHNNAEAVTQYLIPYLENAGATVIPMRERDWNFDQFIVNNDDGDPSYVEIGGWQTSSLTGYRGSTYRYATTVVGSATARATWDFDVTTAGRYAVYVWYVPGANRAPDARYTVYHAGGATEVTVNQRVGPETWHYLGTFPFVAGPAQVTLDNGSAYEDVAVIADAVRIGGGRFDDLAYIGRLAPATTYTDETPPPTAPLKSWWESATFYYSQWAGLDADDWSYLNDVVARPIYARWHQAARRDDAVYISWHTNGYNGSARGTVSYVHNGETHPRTDGSRALQAAVHDELVNDIRAGWDPAWQDRGKKEANLGEVRMLWDSDVPEARMPGVLLEIAFHDNEEDGYALKDPGFNQLAARAVYQGIVKYFEARDGIDLAQLPEPPTQLRMENVGGGAVRISWAPSSTDTKRLVGDGATSYRVYTSSDGFGWRGPIAVSGSAHTIQGLTPGETVYARVTAVNSGGESLPSEVMGARAGEARLLIVQGFDKLNRFGLVSENDPVEGVNLRMWADRMNSRSYVVHHGSAVPPAMAWDSASDEAVAGGAVVLQNYAIVDWILGEENSNPSVLNATERSRIADYLDLGGSLLISGSELAWDLVEQQQAPEFVRDKLHTDYVADDAGSYTVRAVAGGIFDGLNDMRFDAVGEYDADYPDVLMPLSGAWSALSYVGGRGGTAAVQYAAGCQRLLVLGFPFETLRAETRPAAMDAAMAFLDACGPSQVTIFSPQAGGYYRSTPEFEGTATGEDLTNVEIQLQREADSLYWTGTNWAAATWLAADGTYRWSYQPPTLPEGAYTLRVRPAGVQYANAVGSPQAETPFAIDVTAPLTPTVVGPTAMATVVGPLAQLTWLPPADSGTPLHYEIAIDADSLPSPAVYTTTVHSLTLTLSPGVHTWKVRAVDGAGNEGPWSASHAFDFDVVQLILPLCFKN